MSVVSSRSTTTSVSSILKNSELRVKLIAQRNRVKFKLPKNLKNILINYEDGSDKRSYKDFIYTLTESVIKDNEFLDLFNQVKQCISQLGPQHKIIIEALLNINWTNRCQDAINVYKIFIEDLICIHIEHCKIIIDKLVGQFKPISPDADEWPDGEPREQDLERLSHIHDVILKILKIIPMSNSILLQVLSSKFPYMKATTHMHEIYISSLLEIIIYIPENRREILSLIINKLVILDVHAPRSQLESSTDDKHLESLNDKIKLENDNKNIHQIGHTLDVCMNILLTFINKTCYENNMLNIETAKLLYFDIIDIFEKSILTTYQSNHVQFIIFYITSFKLVFIENFLNLLLNKIMNPNVALIIRQASASYLASYVARSNFISIEMIKSIIYDLKNWIDNYIKSQNSYDGININMHNIFYTICQSLFYIISFRHKDLTIDKKNIVFLENLNLNNIITSKLNPLKYCLPNIVKIFSMVTKLLQIAYCFNIINNNNKKNLPILKNSNFSCNFKIDTFFPFDYYNLKISGKFILPLFKQYDGCVVYDDDKNLDNNQVDNDDDDFILESSNDKTKSIKDKIICEISISL
ncbi:RNA polymerase I-specific transcription initiation factor RRN3-like [Aphidius gifuensis]|uniref:RNA polymerase I-specific transcription initiation factor RRN3-like n=1 Tax=Aphidius gifuensis TaxID=684658 RepID=UPI001CDC3327|nr:RNA polymerase I-specific transcription initiation factor RRN3-like [Aphidius gifuensis]